jgi:translation elongation factor EF-Ts
MCTFTTATSWVCWLKLTAKRLCGAQRGVCQLTKDVALQIASSPETKYITKDEVPAGEAEAYEDGAEEFYKQAVLVEQPFVRNASETIGR